MKTEFKILEFIHTVVQPKYYIILYWYIHNKVCLRPLKDQNCICLVYWFAAHSSASEEPK